MALEFSRTELLIGKEAVEKLHNKKVAIFGIGGVGSYVVEGLARAGIGKFVLIDHDHISESNMNRQLHTTIKTMGKEKVDVMMERIVDINPRAEVKTIKIFYLPELADEIIGEDWDYIVDAVDTITAKIDLVKQANIRNIPIISCMGAGNKLDPTRFEVSDIYKTSVCPLAKVMRKELKQIGIKELKVVYSKENPIKPYSTEIGEKETDKDGTIESTRREKQIPGSISFVPSVAGLIIAGEVIKDLIE